MKLDKFNNTHGRSLSSREVFKWHVDFCFYVAVGVCAIVLLKTGVLQLTDLYLMKFLETKHNLQKEKLIFPARGEVLDRNGILLATSLPFQTLAMDPYKMRSISPKRQHRAFEILVTKLGITTETALKELCRRRASIIIVKRAIDFKTASQVKKYIRKGLLPGIEIIREQIREYPWGDDLRSILGVVRGSKDIFMAYKQTNKNIARRALKSIFPWYEYSDINTATPQRGIGGIEQVFDTFLAGKPEKQILNLDRNQNPIDKFPGTRTDGALPCSVVLTIDVHLQQFIARIIQEKVIEKQANLGMAVVMEAATGEILSAYSASFEKHRLISNDSRIFTSSFEPGSVAKPLMILYALDLGAICRTDRFNCNLAAKIANKTYRDEHSYKHNLSLKDILTVSSDSGMAQIVARVMSKSKDKLPGQAVAFYNSCGIGKNLLLHHTAIPRSDLPAPARWTGITPSQLAIGYEFKASPLHLVRIYAGFANNGSIPYPCLVKKIINQNNETVKTFQNDHQRKKCFNPRHAALIYDYLKSVTSSKHGTGRRAAIAGYDIAGKTGTARRFVNGRYSRRSHNAAFIGILPLEKDYNMVIGIFFQDIKKGSDYGGTACAPVFKEVGEYLIANRMN